jgi:hypothetical protein
MVFNYRWIARGVSVGVPHLLVTVRGQSLGRPSTVAGLRCWVRVSSAIAEGQADAGATGSPIIRSGGTMDGRGMGAHGRRWWRRERGSASAVDTGLRSLQRAVGLDARGSIRWRRCGRDHTD